MTKRKKAVDGRDIQVYLSDSQIKLATQIGGGGARDTSKGIRIALAYYRDHVMADASPGNVIDSAPRPGPATQPAAKPINIFDVPLPGPKPRVALTAEGEEAEFASMNTFAASLTPEEIEQERAKNRADAERAEQKQRHYEAAAHGKAAFVAPKGAHDNDDDEPYTYNPEDYPPHLR